MRRFVNTSRHKMRILPVVTLVGILTLVGATIAFYGDSATFNNSFTLQGETEEATFVDTFESPENWSPCDETPKTAVATNKNTTPRYVRMKINDYWRENGSQTDPDDHETSDLPKTWTDSDNIAHSYTTINYQNREDWDLGSDGWYYFNTALGQNESTSSLLESVTFNCEVNLAGETRYSVDGKTAESTPTAYADAQYHVYVTFEMSDVEWQHDIIPRNVVARIERTQKLYESIMEAHRAAEANDVITLLVDTQEIVTNSKTVTLDLNNHTVTGSLTNTYTGNITLINGEINNPNGAAVVNNGTLTMGVNDYNPDTGEALIDNNNVRLIGTTIGLQQTSNNYRFYYYDGCIEGDIGMAGGYDGAPMYHRYADAQDVYFWPFVYNRIAADNHRYQHVELKSADNAVSKTSVHGDIYYMDLQDNINTSIMTGYKIYAVSDYPIFSASYDITIPSGAIIEFDLVGHDIRWNNLTVVNGDFTIYDSNSTTDPTTCETTYAGEISFQQTITGTGTLRLDHSKLSNTVNSNTLMNFGGKLIMQNAALYTYSGHALTSVTGATYDVDACSTITTNRSNSTIYNTMTDFVWDTGGKISNNNSYAFENTASASATLKGGVWNSPTSIVSRDGAPITIDGATISSTDAGISGGTITMKSGSININAYSGWHYGITSGYTMNLTGGTINVVSTGGNAVGVNFGARYNQQTSLTLDGVTITANTTRNNPAYGVRVSMLYCDEAQTNTAIVNVKSGSITSITDTGTAYGIYSNSPHTYVENGTIYGTTAGVYSVSNKCPITVGVNDGTISNNPVISGGAFGLQNGGFYFYDGTIRGNTEAIQTATPSIVQAVPDGAIVQNTTGTDYAYEAHLIPDQNYLRVGSTEYNSLIKAYNAITGDSGTITVIRDATVDSVLSESPAGKEITLDLNGFSLTYSQSLTVSATSTLNIVDNSQAQTGALHNSSNQNSTIVNHGTLNINSGLVDSGRQTIYNQTPSGAQNSTVNLNGGTVKCITICIYNESNTNTNITGGQISITEASTSEQYGIYNYQTSSNVTMTGGQIYINRPADSSTTVVGINRGTVLINTPANHDAIVVSAQSGSAIGIQASYGTKTIQSGNIRVSGTGALYGLANDGAVEMKTADAKIFVENTGADDNTSSATGIAAKPITFTAGSVYVSAKSGDAYGLSYGGRTNTTIKGGDITVNSINGISRGLYIPDDDWDCTRNTLNMSGGDIVANSTNGTSYGAYIGRVWFTITGGKIQGGDYGIYDFASGTGQNYRETLGANASITPSSTTPEIIGKNQYAIYSNDIYFYTGVLRGAHAYKEGGIKAIPDSYVYHTEASVEYPENCWLEAARDYLSVDGTPYNSLTDAYAAITGSSGTITVIDDAVVEAVLPSNPSGKNITFDLNDHELTFTQPLIFDKADTTITIVDNGTNHSGILYNSNPNSNTIALSRGALNFNSGKVSSKNVTVNISSASPIININGGTIECETTCVYDVERRGTINFTSGLVTNKDIGENQQIAFSGSTLNMTGGQIRMTRAANSTNTSDAIALHNLTAQIELIDNSQPAIYIDVPTATGVALRDLRSVTANNATLSVNGNNAYGFLSGEGARYNGTFNNATLDINAINTAYGIYSGAVTINTNSTITATAQSGAAYGFYIVGHWRYGQTEFNMNSGTVTANSLDGNAYGLYGESSEGIGGYLNLNAGTISGNSTNATGYGIYTRVRNNTINVKGGTVSGSNYGMYGYSSSDNYATFNIGENDGTLDTNSPVIIGKDYGIYQGIVSFYDGRLKGTIAAHHNRNVKFIPEDAVIHADTEVIGNDTYYIEYLVAGIDVAKIGTTTYKRLDAAINAANTGDTIELLADNYLYYNLNITNDKDITIDAGSFNIIPINPIVNEGTVTIIGDSNNSPLLDYIESGYAITNATNASLTIKNFNISAVNAIDNSGTLTLDNTSIEASNNAIKNTGNTSISNGTQITGANYAFYSTTGTNTIADSTIVDGIIYNNAGSLTLTNVVASSRHDSTNDPESYIVNGDSATIATDNFQATYIFNTYNTWRQALYNAGTASITNSSITQTDGNIILRNYGSGTITTSNSDFVITSAGTNTGYGIYSPTGNVTMPTGSVSIRNYKYAYGIYTETGILTLGEAEPIDSPDRGQPTAHIDNTNPAISAIGTSGGTGITFGNGQVYFYDGISTGTSSAINKDPSVIEYLWRVKYGTDESGHHYMIQEFAQN